MKSAGNRGVVYSRLQVLISSGRQGGKESLPFHRRREADVDGTDVSAQ